MKLVAFGDSFVEGLIKEPFENTFEERKEINFVNQLVKLENKFTESENLSLRGSGNSNIAYSVYKRLKQSSTDCFFLICWSSLTRDEEYNNKEDFYFPVALKKKFRINKNYKFETEMYMSGIHNILKYYQIPHAFVNSFCPHVFLNNTLSSDFFQSLNYINPHFTRNTLFDIISERYNKDGLINEEEIWQNHTHFNVKKSKYITKCLHPSKKGHDLIAKTLNPYINNLLDKQAKEYNIKV